jgi:nitroreductase
MSLEDRARELQCPALVVEAQQIGSEVCGDHRLSSKMEAMHLPPYRVGHLHSSPRFTAKNSLDVTGDLAHDVGSRFDACVPVCPRLFMYRALPLDFLLLPREEMKRRAATFEGLMARRRSVRHFSDRSVPVDLIEHAIRTAALAPSGANQQPWVFVAISDLATKRAIRIAAETEEFETLEGRRMPNQWRDALQPLGTGWQKEFLERAPWLVAVFQQPYSVDADGTRKHNYYVKESVGMACGLFVAAVHNMGLGTLPHTPSPMAFLGSILGRPANEKPYMLLPVGYPEFDATVPDIDRKPFEEVVVFVTKSE